MTEHVDSEKTIFFEALEKASPQERMAFVEKACAGNSRLLARVQVLLAAHEQSRGPLDQPPPGVAVTIERPIAEGPGTMIGHYELLEEIGEGGFGVVYMAEQREPVRRKVALKVIKPGMDTGKPRGALGGHISEVWSLAFSPDGQRLAVGTRHFQSGKGYPRRPDLRDQGGELRVWELSSGRQEVAFRWTLDNYSLAFSPDGRLLAAAGCHFFETFVGGKARVWEVGTWREVATLEGHRRGATSVAFSPDGKLLATGGQDGAVRLWDIATWQERLVLPWTDRAVRPLSWSAGMSTLAAAVSSGRVKVWRAADPGQVSQYLKDAGDRTWAGWLHRSETAGEGWEGVAADCSKAIETKPDEPYAWVRRAYAREQTGDYAAAIADATAALRLQPDNATARSNRIAVHVRQRNLDAAIADLSILIEQKPQDVELWCRRAVAHAAAGHRDEYRKDCGEMLRRFDKTVEPTVADGVAWTCALTPDATADWPKAIALAEKAAQSDFQSASFATTLGAVLYRAGRFESAIGHLAQAGRLVEEATDSIPNTSPAPRWFFLAMAHHRLGHTEDSKQWLDRAASCADKALREDERNAQEISWRCRLTLRLLRAEAETMIKGQDVKPRR